MKTKFADKVFHMLFICILVLAVAAVPNANVSADWSFPVFMLNVDNDSSWQSLNAWNWPLGSQVTLSVDDPHTLQNPDYTEMQTMAEPNPGGSTISHAIYMQDNNFEGHPGFTITLSDGVQTKTMIVPLLVITGYNLANDTITGVSDPFTTVTVPVSDANGSGYAERTVVTDSEGNWLANFGVSEFTFDLQPGHVAEPQIFDADWDHIVLRDWSVPFIRASINRPGHSIDGYGWPLHSSVTLTVDNPGNGIGIDYSDVQIVGLNEWDPNQTQVQFDLEDFRLETGTVVTLTDGMTTGTHTVDYLEIMNVDTATDRIFGRAGPGSTVQVQFRSVHRNMVADQAGNWTADFSTPGSGNDEKGLIDIQPGVGFTTLEYSDGSNSTRLYWQVPAPKIIAYPDEDAIAATDFWPGVFVTITVDDPGNGEGVDITRSGEVSMETGGWNCQTYWGYCFVLDLWNEFDVQAGQLITITDGTHTISHVVTTLWITNVDLANSTVSGTAKPLSEIYLDLWPSCGQRHLFADENGNWLEDFFMPGDEDFEQETCDFRIDPLRDVVAYQGSGEGETWMGWYMPDDTDGDGITDDIDNAPNVFNPDQRDVDEDGTADVLDPCPDDAADACDANGSAANVVGEQGGTVATPNGKASLNIPAGSVQEDISFTITDMGAGYEIASDDGSMVIIHSYSIQPSGTQFAPPATIMFRWDDTDNNGVVDGTTLQETDLLLIKDGLVITSPCGINPGCNMTTNELTVEVSSLSLYVLAVPANQPPQITAITAPVNPVQIGQTILATATFTDPDLDDTHTALWNWGDGSTATVPAMLATVSAFHNYDAPGVYTITITITDAVGESDIAAFQYVVLYDPSGGFVTGGGWINSPEGAYTADLTLTGKATFGFVSKYQKGASVPTGNTEFQFKVADLNFKSTSYDWLVVSGSKAKYKGTGTINGTGEYGFMLSAIDGTPDKFRIKIWEKTTGEIVYDNQLGTADDADPITLIGGGSIVVHKEK